MNTFQALFLGLLQGITEFLPVSSSGHLVLAEHIFGLKVENLLSFDIIVHTGTLLALLIYFWKTWRDIIKEIFTPKKWLQSTLLKLIVATLPAVVVALLFKEQFETIFRGTNSVLIAMIVTALLLIIGEKLGKQNEEAITYPRVILMGLLQAFAIIPGISRSGSTITGGLVSNLKRAAAAKFAFLMAVPAIGGAFVLSVKESLEGTMILPELNISLAGFFASFIASIICIHYFLIFVKKYPLYIFSIYLLIIAIVGLSI